MVALARGKLHRYSDGMAGASVHPWVETYDGVLVNKGPFSDGRTNDLINCGPARRVKWKSAGAASQDERSRKYSKEIRRQTAARPRRSIPERCRLACWSRRLQVSVISEAKRSRALG